MAIVNMLENIIERLGITHLAALSVSQEVLMLCINV